MKIHEIQTIRTDAALAALEPEWRRLYEEAQPRNPFLSWEWISACRAHLAPGSTPFVVAARQKRGCDSGPYQERRCLGHIR